MTIYFITGNKKKFREAGKLLPGIKQLKLDLPEIQEIDAHKIIREKLGEARKHAKGEFITEDTSLYLECMNGLPGPLIKWFLKTIGNKGISSIAEKMENKKAEARTIIGYCKGEKILFFEGVVKGMIVKPRKEESFGWDPIFIPHGNTKSFAEMSVGEKNKVSMRSKAFNKLQNYLKNQ